ncbi:MAG TPA: ABC transporter substrate-binding protein [Stellaceae bacterium]|nr:ABC transporter substrate-binding protein [Stellaceae bacterium]
MANILTKAARSLLWAVAALTLAPLGAGAEPIKLGLSKTFTGAAVFIAQERGYFAAEGVPAELVFFDSAEPVAVAVASRAIDFGVAPFTGGFYNLASHDALRVIAGGAREAPGFHYFAYIASKQAYAAGLISLKDLAGHAVATTQFGSSGHYALALLIEKYGLNPNNFRIVPLQTLTNIRSAIGGGQVDAAVTNGASALRVIERGDAKLLGWVGDETPWQVAAAFTATATAKARRATVERVLRAYRKAVGDYCEAFIAADGTRRNGPTAPQIEAIIAKYAEQPVEEVDIGIPYFDCAARLDVDDVLHQIAWYKANGMVKAPVNGEQLVDKRYVVALPKPATALAGSH